ncbi:MAG: 2-hydroxyacyl-CoA dehydratase family protein [Deltaproteobacteria bacterium]|jgi:benzoyl-CoA reductase/2-hydroxyglutaryl-CoA dehydratase subunit BcrC/BadD/HgdB|nr:2-hydroxyacyl-CoA dehydratase family protein [Deltaproteobacteria bacterium]
MGEISREEKLRSIAAKRYLGETSQESLALKNRPDHFPELDYFLSLLEGDLSPQRVAERVQKPLVALMCLQAPLELFHALGFHPFKIFGGSVVTTRLSSPVLPPVMCPMLRSALGALMLDRSGEDGNSPWKAWVAPTTCDWVVKLDDLLELCGIKNGCPSHRLELPHLKDRPESQERWLEEIYALKKFLLGVIGQKKLAAKDLQRSMEVYQKAFKAFSALIDLKRAGKISLAYFLAIANSFFFAGIEEWTENLKKILPKLKEEKPRQGPKVFLAGSPIFFPNLKMPHLLEEAGLVVVMDDLCSSERLFPGAAFFDDLSEHGLLKALAQRYHQGCLCPTFADNDRRVNNIIAPAHKDLYLGVVFHVLKGCHPFDLESLSLEPKLKDEGLKFIKLETDYTAEDSGTLLTRLEAFRSSLAN